jgi:hypothetical protein
MLLSNGRGNPDGNKNPSSLHQSPVTPGVLGNANLGVLFRIPPPGVPGLSLLMGSDSPYLAKRFNGHATERREQQRHGDKSDMLVSHCESNYAKPARR